MSLEETIIDDLTTELGDEPGFNQAKLEKKVKNAIREVALKRNYKASSLSEEEIEEDLENYYSVIRNVALYDYNQIGIEFQVNSSENGNSRTYMTRDDLFKGVHAFVKVFCW